MTINPQAIEDLSVTREDFELALQNDVKPSFGANIEDFENYVKNGKWFCFKFNSCFQVFKEPTFFKYRLDSGKYVRNM